MKIEDVRAAVIDASVGAKLFVLEPGTEQADRLFSLLAADPAANFFVPDLFYIECTNIFWKYVRRFGYAVDNARQDVADLLALNLHPIPTAELAAEALELALELDSSVYDACYTALAHRLDLPLLTADETLAQKMGQAGRECLLLKEFE